MNRLFPLCLTILAILICASQAYACDKLTVRLKASLSTDAKVAYSVDPGQLNQDDAPTISIPLDVIGASDTQLSLRFTRVDYNTWKLQVYNDLKSDVLPGTGDVRGTSSLIEFKEANSDHGPIRLDVLPSSMNNIASTTQVALVVDEVVISDKPSNLSVVSFHKEKSECPGPSYSKKAADAQRDEFNPIRGKDALTAFLR